MWKYPARSIRFTASPINLLTNPELIPLFNFASMINLPKETLPNGDIVYYLSELLPDHQLLLEAANIIIETKP